MEMAGVTSPTTIRGAANSMCSYLPGVILARRHGIGVGCTALFALLTRNSMVAFRFPWQLFVFSTVGVTLIASFAALLSIRKVITLEPAVVFRS